MNPFVVEEKYRTSFGATQTSLVALMFAFSVMSYFDRTIMSIAGPEIMKEFWVEPTQMGWVYSAFILGYALFMIPGGDVADRLGPRNTLTLMGLAGLGDLVATCSSPLSRNRSFGEKLGQGLTTVAQHQVADNATNVGMAVVGCVIFFIARVRTRTPSPSNVLSVG